MALPPRGQGPNKKDLTPLTKGGSVQKHAGKGSSIASMPNRNTLSQLSKPDGQSINDYAKASPMGQPQSPAVDGLGSGRWAGNGM